MSETLTEFLLARIAEDEAVAREVDPSDSDPSTDAEWAEDALREQRWAAQPHGRVCAWRMGEGMARACECGYPARVLAECEAKRRIVALHEEWPVLIQTEPTIEAAPDLGNFAYRASQQIAWATNREYVARFGTEAPTTTVLRALALPYADHPDYSEAWRP